MATIIAGISGAIGQALALKYLDEFPEQPVIGLCRKVAALSGQLPNRQQGLALASRSLRF